MRTGGLTCFALILFAASACHPYQTVASPVPVNFPGDDDAEVRVTPHSGHRVDLVGVRIDRDSLRGREVETGAPLAYALTNLDRIEVRTTGADRATGHLLTIVLAGAALVAVAAVYLAGIKF